MYAAFAKDHLTFKDPLLRRLARFELFHLMMRPKPVVGRTRRDDPRIAANCSNTRRARCRSPRILRRKSISTR
jgi:hypothetical protein